VQHRLWGDQPLGYHLVTFLCHVGAATLFALCLRRLAIPGAWLAALLFALHPVHVESVAWITEQKNTLSLVCYLAAALVYLDYDETRRPRAYYAALGLFALSLLCKTVTATLPAALLVVFWWKRGRLEWRRDFRPLLPWLALGAVAGLFSSWVEQHYLGAKGQGFDLPFLARGLVAGRAVWFYLGKLVWPFNLNFIYPRWTPDAAVGWQWLFPLGVLALVAAVWALRRRTRGPLAALLFFVGSLFPVLGFVNLYGAFYSFVWDHWQYLPDLGPITLAAAGLVQAWNWAAIRRRGAGPVLVALLGGMLGALTWHHCGMFRDDPTLFRATLARNPDAWMAHFNLGGLWLKVPGREPEAIAQFEAALRIKPDLADAHYNLGTILAKTPDRLPEAIAHFEAALRMAPANATVHYNLGNALANMPGRLPDAIDHYRAALRINPELAEAHYNLGLALLNDPRQIPEAIAHFEAALRIRPDFPFAREIVARWRAAQR
jgi:Flp pilus assembly protein TadD